MHPKTFAKHIIEDIWELRPDKYRETQKTPTREIKKAIQLRDDWNKQIH
jgi:hypothetical protein